MLFLNKVEQKALKLPSHQLTVVTHAAPHKLVLQALLACEPAMATLVSLDHFHSHDRSAWYSLLGLRVE